LTHCESKAEAGRSFGSDNSGLEWWWWCREEVEFVVEEEEPPVEEEEKEEAPEAPEEEPGPKRPRRPDACTNDDAASASARVCVHELCIRI
jgi:hypothetical protein